MTTLIFGGAGFVGLNVAEALLRAGRDVALFDRAPPPPPAVDELGALGGGLRMLVGDVRKLKVEVYPGMQLGGKAADLAARGRRGRDDLNRRRVHPAPSSYSGSRLAASFPA
jgi:UDP-glucose 4-epimerase